MNKKTIGILSAALLLAGGLILQNLYKRKKLKGLEDGLEPLKKGAKKMRKILEQAHVSGTPAHN
jgi:di/tricarboxylate transporter